MANLIRLKQIESGSALTTAAETGTNFSQSVIDVITSEVQSVLPEGIISSSAQIVLSQTTGNLTSSRLDGDIIASAIEYNNILSKPSLISASAQLDGSTLRNITIAPINSDGYSLTISGAVAIVNATDLSDGGIGDMDSTVPAQIWLDGNQTTSSVAPPIDPSINNQATANEIDMGEW